MEFATLAILSSTVLAALVTGYINKNMKIKELKTQVNLQEKHEWIKNVDQAFDDFIKKSNRYGMALSKYSINQIDHTELSEYIFSLNSAFYKIIFYISQSEYMDRQDYKIGELIQNIMDESDSLRNKVLIYNEKLVSTGIIDGERLNKDLDNFEINMDQYSLELSKLLGAMISKEKEKMIFNIIDIK